MSEQAPKPVLTQEQEPASRIQDPEPAYWMGHAMVANMDRALEHRQAAKDAFEGSYGYMREGVLHFSGQSEQDKNTVYAIKHEELADVDAQRAQEAFDTKKNGPNEASRTEAVKNLDSLTRENRRAGYVEPIRANEINKFKPLLEKDAAKKQEQDKLHETLFMQEGQKILFDSRNVKIEADKLAKAFTTGSSPNLEQAAKLSISNFNATLRDYFNPSRIAEWQKRGQLNHAPSQINGALSSIALTAGLGEKKSNRFVPEKLDLFKDPGDVISALEFIGRHTSGKQAIDIAQKSMRLLSSMQTYETIMAPAGKKLDPLEANLIRISDMVGAGKETVETNKPPMRPIERDREAGRRVLPEREPRRQLTEEELRRFGRRAMPEQERFYDRSRER